MKQAFGSYISKFTKVTKPETPEKTNTPVKSKSASKEKVKVNKNFKANDDIHNENLKFILKREVDEKRVTRSASKSNKSEEKLQKNKNVIKVTSEGLKKLNINETSKTVSNTDIIAANNNKNNKFLPKSSFLMAKKLKFKDNKINSGSNTNKSLERSKSITNESKKGDAKKTIIKKEAQDKKVVNENKSKSKYSNIPSKVAQFLNKTGEDENNDKTKKVQKNKDSNKNFVRLNLKKGYREHKRVHHKTNKRMKLDRGKAFYKYLNNSTKNHDEYMGSGKDGLQIELEIEGEENSNMAGLKTLMQIKNPHMEVDNVPTKVPHFSEGFYINVLEENKKISEIVEPENPNKLVSNFSKDFSNIKQPKTSITPNRQITNKLTSALRSSIKRKVPLDTELKNLSKEFRCLLSGKKAESEAPQVIEKKLNFNENENLYNKSIKLIEDESDDDDDNLTESEIQKLENDILIKVLEENFGFKEFLPGQLDTIKNILNNKNTLTILPPGSGKSLCFQLPSLVSEGFTIVISPLLALITDQITKLPSCLSGACLSSFTTLKQRNEIFEAIKDNKIRILFTTPERFAIENFSEIENISLICFDEAITACPLNQNYRPSYASVVNAINKIKPNALLFLANNMTILLEENLKSQYRIDATIKQKISFPKNVKLSISKEDNKLASALKLLRSTQFKNIGSTIIFCNTKKNVDKVTSYLNQNGLSASSYHSGKSEVERQMIQANFNADKIKMMVCTIGFSMGISKSDIRLVVIFDIPSSVENLIQQVGRAGRDKKDTFVHIFLNDEDYFQQRNVIYSENIDKTQIMKFLDYFNGQVNPTTNKNTKRNFQEAFENKPIVSDGLNLPKMITLNFSSVIDYCGIKKQTLIYLIFSLLENANLNIQSDDENIEMSENPNYSDNTLINFSSKGIGPSIINIRFYKSTPESLAESEPNMKLILESSKEFQGIRRFSTLEVCEKIGINYSDLINYLYHLQSKSEIGYEIKDEGIFLHVSKLPENYKNIFNYLNDRVQYLVNLNLKKLNATYTLIRKFALGSYDPINKPTGIIKCLNTYNDLSSYEADFKKHFEDYFEINDGNIKLIFRKSRYSSCR
jgi:RecQ family ATP-dependent DNA helicase